MMSRLFCAMLLAGVACGAHASTVLFDFENDAEVRIVPERRHGAAYATNICATSGLTSSYVLQPIMPTLPASAD